VPTGTLLPLRSENMFEGLDRPGRADEGWMQLWGGGWIGLRGPMKGWMQLGQACKEPALTIATIQPLRQRSRSGSYHTCDKID